MFTLPPGCSSLSALLSCAEAHQTVLLFLMITSLYHTAITILFTGCIAVIVWWPSTSYVTRTRWIYRKEEDVDNDFLHLCLLCIARTIPTTGNHLPKDDGWAVCHCCCWYNNWSETMFKLPNFSTSAFVNDLFTSAWTILLTEECKMGCYDSSQIERMSESDWVLILLADPSANIVFNLFTL